ncbi:DUF6234 family protein [Nonomuraea sp. NPDC047529]|uniref:DUF6234 family protein n=1 Tax=Nonomuraea sp. NPDC047529 TaxID=3155623 RepID=UPI0033FA54DF
METAETEPGTISGIALGLLVLIWFFGVPLCLMQAFEAGLAFREVDQASVNAWLTAAAWIFAAAPVLATGICLFTDRHVGAWIFGVIAAACVIFVLGSVQARQAKLHPVPSPSPSNHCMERSGGGNDCPGG